MAIIFPPIVDTYVPTFVEECEIPFIMPSLNNSNDLADKVIVSIVEQNTNRQIKKNLNTFFLANYKENIVTINFEKESALILKPKKYYKVQLKFFDKSLLNLLTSIEEKGNQKESNVFLNEGVLSKYSSYLSEWSTICLIKKLSIQPLILIDNFIRFTDYSSPYYLSTFDGFFSGRAIFGEEDDENLKKIEFNLLDRNNIILEKQEAYSANNRTPNAFIFTPHYNLKEGELYNILIKGTSQNDYVFSYKVSFILNTVIKNAILPLDTTIAAENEEEYARNKIKIKSKENFKGNFVIKRTSNKSDFNYWEDVHFGNFAIKKNLDYTWFDYTIEDGTVYKYCIQGLLKSGNKILRSSAIMSNDAIVFSTFKSTFLATENRQLNIKYNTEISSFSTVTKESKIETLGSKYPFIRKNGYLGYREFSLSGLITLHMDVEDKIMDILEDSTKNISKEEIENYTFYSFDEIYNFSNNEEIKEIEKKKIKEYKEQNNLNEYNDTLYERLFREKVIDFLQKDNVKLFKSPTEGNLLVKLTNITLSPADTALGRYLYNFSCTATEIDDFSIQNCDLYNIQTIGGYKENSNITSEKNIFGQYVGAYSGNILSLIDEKYKNQTDNESRINTVQYLNYLKIEFEDKPMKTPLNQLNMLGYQFQLNGNNIFVNPNGVFELSGEDVKITDLIIPNNQKVSILYQAVVLEQDAIQKEASSKTWATSIGQITGYFDNEQGHFKKVLNGKYYIKNDSFYQVLNSINEISIEADPGTIFYIADSGDNLNNQEYTYNTHIVGKTGTLNLYNLNKESTYPLILDLYSGGMHFYKINSEDYLRATLDNSYYEYNELIGENKNFENENLIIKPQEHCVYTINQQRYIYYNKKFYLIDDEDNIQIKKEATITYIYTKEVGSY